jgi:hypothetical protein
VDSRYAALACLCPVLGFMALVTVAGWSARRGTRRGLEALAAAACPKCGAALGQAGAKAAHAVAMERLRQVHADAKERGVILRVDPRWRFACPACAAELRFDPDTKALEAA